MMHVLHYHKIPKLQLSGLKKKKKKKSHIVFDIFLSQFRRRNIKIASKQHRRAFEFLGRFIKKIL